jgi:hypothetical protein
MKKKNNINLFVIAIVCIVVCLIFFLKFSNSSNQSDQQLVKYTKKQYQTADQPPQQSLSSIINNVVKVNIQPSSKLKSLESSSTFNQQFIIASISNVPITLIPTDDNTKISLVNIEGNDRPIDKVNTSNNIYFDRAYLVEYNNNCDILIVIRNSDGTTIYIKTSLDSNSKTVSPKLINISNKNLPPLNNFVYNAAAEKPAFIILLGDLSTTYPTYLQQGKYLTNNGMDYTTDVYSRSINWQITEAENLKLFSIPKLVIAGMDSVRFFIICPGFTLTKIPMHNAMVISTNDKSVTSINATVYVFNVVGYVQMITVKATKNTDTTQGNLFWVTSASNTNSPDYFQCNSRSNMSNCSYQLLNGTDARSPTVFLQAPKITTNFVPVNNIHTLPNDVIATVTNTQDFSQLEYVIQGLSNVQLIVQPYTSKSTVINTGPNEYAIRGEANVTVISTMMKNDDTFYTNSINILLKGNLNYNIFNPDSISIGKPQNTNYTEGINYRNFAQKEFLGSNITRPTIYLGAPSTPLVTKSLVSRINSVNNLQIDTMTVIEIVAGLVAVGFIVWCGVAAAGYFAAEGAIDAFAYAPLASEEAEITAIENAVISRPSNARSTYGIFRQYPRSTTQIFASMNNRLISVTADDFSYTTNINQLINFFETRLAFAQGTNSQVELQTELNNLYELGKVFYSYRRDLRIQPFQQLYNYSLMLAEQETLTTENNLIIQNNLILMRQRVMNIANWVVENNPMGNLVPAAP